MFKHKSKYLLLIFCLPLFGQNKINQTDDEGRRHGMWKMTFEGTQQLKFEGNFEHGIETEAFKFYKKGFQEHPSAIIEFQDDINATATYYTQEGKPISRGKLKNKEREGRWVYFHNKSDDTMMVEHYSGGELNGLQITYFPDGVTAEKTEYLNGRKHGESLIFGKNGQVLQHLKYRDGELHGPAVYYDASGKKMMEGEYRDGRKTGNWHNYENREIPVNRDQ